MANRGSSTSTITTYEPGPMDKVSSSTLKRHPKMELSKGDLLKMLSYYEGELQAKEIVIATLRAESVKQLLYHTKHGKFGNDPFAALQRDSYGAYEKHFDENAVKGMYNNQLTQLENLIKQHRNAQARLEKQLGETNEAHAKMMSELEEEKQKHAQDTAQGDDVTYLLEKERERLNKQIEFEKLQNHKIDKEIKKLTQDLELEKLKQKQIVLLLLEDRRRLGLKLLEERQKCFEIAEILTDKNFKIEEMVDGLEEESKKSLQMEAEMERQLSEFDTERGQLHHRLTVEETKCKHLQEEVDILRRELDRTREQLMLGNMVSNPNIRVTQSGIAGGGLAPPRTAPRPVSPKPPNLSSQSTSNKPSIPPKVGAALQQRASSQQSSSNTLPVQQPPGVPPKTGSKAFQQLPSPMPSLPVVDNTSATPEAGSRASKVFKLPSPLPSHRIVDNVPNVSLEVASKVSVTPVIPQMATEPSSNRHGPQDNIPDTVATYPPVPVGRVPPNEQSVPISCAGSQMTGSAHTNAGTVPGARVFNSQSQHGKVPFSQPSSIGPPPIAPPKKQIPTGRGAPPPVPPNKPVLSSHQILQKKESINKGMVANRTEVESSPPAVEVTGQR